MASRTPDLITRTALRHVALCQQTSRALLQAGPAGSGGVQASGAFIAKGRDKNQNDDGGDNPDDDRGGKLSWRDAASGHFRA
jgi:hypothetical protein